MVTPICARLSAIGGGEMHDWVAALTAVSTGIIAFMAIMQVVRERTAEARTRREFARTRAINFMIDQVLSDKISTMMSETRKLSRRGGALVRLNDFVSGEGDDERFTDAEGYAVVMDILNFYEAMAIGIKKGAIDPKIMHEWWGEPTLFHWDLFREFVADFRTRRPSPTAFVEFESLARSWSPARRGAFARIAAANPFRNSRAGSAETFAPGDFGRARAA